MRLRPAMDDTRLEDVVAAPGRTYARPARRAGIAYSNDVPQLPIEWSQELPGPPVACRTRRTCCTRSHVFHRLTLSRDDT